MLSGYDYGGTSSDMVTSLARDARRVIAGPAGRGEAEAVLRRIDGMMARWSEMPAAPINTSLTNLRTQVERA